MPWKFSIIITAFPKDLVDLFFFSETSIKSPNQFIERLYSRGSVFENQSFLNINCGSCDLSISIHSACRWHVQYHHMTDITQKTRNVTVTMIVMHQFYIAIMQFPKNHNQIFMHICYYFTNSLRLGNLTANIVALWPRSCQFHLDFRFFCVICQNETSKIISRITTYKTKYI